MTCDDCGCEDDTVEETTCPYAEEINDEEELIIVCASCYAERGMAI